MSCYKIPSRFILFCVCMGFGLVSFHDAAQELTTQVKIFSQDKKSPTWVFYFADSRELLSPNHNISQNFLIPLSAVRPAQVAWLSDLLPIGFGVLPLAFDKHWPRLIQDFFLSSCTRNPDCEVTVAEDKGLITRISKEEKVIEEEVFGKFIDEIDKLPKTKKLTHTFYYQENDLVSRMVSTETATDGLTSSFTRLFSYDVQQRLTTYSVQSSLSKSRKVWQLHYDSPEAIDLNIFEVEKNNETLLEQYHIQFGLIDHNQVIQKVTKITRETGLKTVFNIQYLPE